MTQRSATKTENLEKDFIELSTKTMEFEWSDEEESLDRKDARLVSHKNPLFAWKNSLSRAPVRGTVVFHRALRGFLLDLCSCPKKRGLNGRTGVARNA